MSTYTVLNVGENGKKMTNDLRYLKQELWQILHVISIKYCNNNIIVFCASKVLSSCILRVYWVQLGAQAEQQPTRAAIYVKPVALFKELMIPNNTRTDYSPVTPVRCGEYLTDASVVMADVQQLRQ